MKSFRINFDWRRFIADFCWCSLLGLVGLSVAGFFSQFNWVADIASDFRIQYLIGFSLLAVVFLLLRWRKSAVIATVFALLNGALVLPLYFGRNVPQQAEAHENKLRLMY